MRINVKRMQANRLHRLTESWRRFADRSLHQPMMDGLRRPSKTACKQRQGWEVFREPHTQQINRIQIRESIAMSKRKLKSDTPLPIEDVEEIVIGYSAYDTDEECYEYIENSCYIADTPDSLDEFKRNCWQPYETYQTYMVKLSDIMEDFGVSRGRYIMQTEALKRFERIAKQMGMKYTRKMFLDMYSIEIDSRCLKAH